MLVADPHTGPRSIILSGAATGFTGERPQSPHLLYSWRSACKAGSSAITPEAMPFVPLGVIGGPGERQPALLAAPEHLSGGREPSTARVDHIEIELPNGVRVRVAGAVNEKALSRVFRVLKGVA